MSIFEDKKIEQLDWMTQITETIESKINGVLARLPDKVLLDKDAIMGFISDSYGLTVRADRVVNTVISVYIPDHKTSISNQDRGQIHSCFELQVEPGTIINLEEGTMTGGVFLVKTKQTLDDHELQKIMGQNGLYYFLDYKYHYQDVGRANEVIELLGVGDDKDIFKTRSLKKKTHAIYKRLSEIFQKNEWRIRDTELADKVGMWIAEYMRSGNMAAFTNFCKLKVMTHSEKPIYSIVEEPL